VVVAVVRPVLRPAQVVVAAVVRRVRLRAPVVRRRVTAVVAVVAVVAARARLRVPALRLPLPRHSPHLRVRALPRRAAARGPATAVVAAAVVRRAVRLPARAVADRTATGTL